MNRHHATMTALLATSILAAGSSGLGGCQSGGPPPAAGSTDDPKVLAMAEAAVPIEEQERMRHDAVDVLRQAMLTADPLLRMNAIEGLFSDTEDLAWAVDLGLDDENRAVRFASAISIGVHRMSSIAPRLTEMAATDPSNSVRAAAIYALHVNDMPANLSELATMLQSDDPEVRGNVAMILGELGNPSALPLLESVLGRGMHRALPARARVTDLQIAEAMVQLGDERRLEGIRAALFSPGEQGELTALACQICGRLRDEASAQRLHLMAVRTGDQQQSAEVRMAAAWALGKIDRARAPVSVPLEYTDSNMPAHRAQAALTLGAIGRQSSLPILDRLLSDGDPLVQVSAAAAIVRIVPV